MKNIYYLVIALLVWYTVTANMVEKKCMEHEGWEYLSVFPVPMCHVELNTAPLSLLESIINREFFNVDIHILSESSLLS